MGLTSSASIMQRKAGCNKVRLRMSAMGVVADTALPRKVFRTLSDLLNIGIWALSGVVLSRRYSAFSAQIAPIKLSNERLNRERLEVRKWLNIVFLRLR